MTYDYRAWLETSEVNEYDERVVDHVLADPETGRLSFRCRDDCWRVAFDSWCKAYRDDKNAPQPHSSGHCMFVRPTSYSLVPASAEGDRRRLLTRRALRNRVLAHLDGWDRDLRKSREGMRKLAGIVRATVAAKTEGKSLGAVPFLACIVA